MKTTLTLLLLCSCAIGLQEKKTGHIRKENNKYFLYLANSEIYLLQNFPPKEEAFSSSVDYYYLELRGEVTPCNTSFQCFNVNNYAPAKFDPLSEDPLLKETVEILIEGRGQKFKDLMK